MAEYMQLKGKMMEGSSFARKTYRSFFLAPNQLSLKKNMMEAFRL